LTQKIEQLDIQADEVKLTIKKRELASGQGNQ
jgi:hypothetical protein